MRSWLTHMMNKTSFSKFENTEHALKLKLEFSTQVQVNSLGSTAPPAKVKAATKIHVTVFAVINHLFVSSGPMTRRRNLMFPDDRATLVSPRKKNANDTHVCSHTCSWTVPRS